MLLEKPLLLPAFQRRASPAEERDRRQRYRSADPTRGCSAPGCALAQVEIGLVPPRTAGQDAGPRGALPRGFIGTRCRLSRAGESPQPKAAPVLLKHPVSMRQREERGGQEGRLGCTLPPGAARAPGRGKIHASPRWVKSHQPEQPGAPPSAERPPHPPARHPPGAGFRAVAQPRRTGVGHQHRSDRAEPTPRPARPLLAAAPSPGRAGGFIQPRRSPPRCRKGGFPTADGCSRFPRRGRREELGAFPIGKSFCWEKSRFPGLAAKPAGTVEGTRRRHRDLPSRGGLCWVTPSAPVSASPGRLAALPVPPLGSALGFPPTPTSGARAGRGRPADLVGTAVLCRVGGGNRPVPPGTAPARAHPRRPPAPSPSPPQQRDPVPLPRCGAVAVTPLVSPTLVFHPQFLFRAISAWPRGQFLHVSRE